MRSNPKILILFVFFLASTSTSKADSLRFSVMSFNVENLFDTRDDPGKDDQTYLPRAQKQNKTHKKHCAFIKIRKWREDCLNLDWSEELLSQKLSRIAAVIKSVNAGRGPDIVMLQEIENLEVLRMLNKRHLGGLGYEETLIEGDDERGIDVALLSRIPRSGNAILHQIPFPKGVSDRAARTRGILEVPLRHSSAAKMRVFVVHLPSAFHPARLRRAALEFLGAKTAGFKDTELVVVGGDFNVSAREERKTGVLREFSTHWRISHREGCGPCQGTAYHRGWSFFDQIWVSRSAEKLGWKLVPLSVRVHAPLAFQSSELGPGPRRFEVLDSQQSKGLSDHWPVVLEIEKRVGLREPTKRPSI